MADNIGEAQTWNVADQIGEAVRVQTWDDYIGQKKLKGRLEISMAAARKDTRGLGHMLLAAQSGFGKTTLAQLCAAKMGEAYLSVTRTDERDFLRSVEEFKYGFIILDELHSRSKSFQELLLTGLEDGYLEPRRGPRVDASLITFVGITTEPQNVIRPLRERFIHQPYFEDYTDDDMFQILCNMAECLEVDLPEELARSLTRATGDTPRLAARIAGAARDLNGTGHELTVESVLALAGVDCDGLDDKHLHYLRTLYKQRKPTGLSMLVNLLRLTGPEVQDLEYLLERRGMITFEDRGRTITDAGAAKVRPPSPVRRRVA